jgi:hypothetical protein
MNRPARVRSIDALDHLTAAVRAFASEATVALDGLRMDLHRATQWVQCDQKDYWTQELRRSEQAVTEAKLTLERKRMYRIGDQAPSCREEEKTLEAAKRRVAVAREKLEAVKRWSRLLERHSMECRAGIAPLSDWVQTDVPRAVTLLNRMSGALERYVGMESSVGTEIPAEAAGTATENGRTAGEASPPPGQSDGQPASESAPIAPGAGKEP